MITKKKHSSNLCLFKNDYCLIALLLAQVMVELSHTHKDQSEDRIEMRIDGEVEAGSEARVVMPSYL